MTPLKAPRLADYLGLLVLSLCWGSSFFSVEMALLSFSPLWIAAIRISIAAIALSLFVHVRGHRFPRRKKDIRLLLAAGIVGASIPFTLISFGQTGAESSTASILMAFTPLAAALLAHIGTHDEQLSALKLIGILIGLFGVAALMGGADGDELFAGALYKLAILMGAICYAASSLILRKASNLPTEVGAAGVMIGGALSIIPLALIAGEAPDALPGWRSVIAVLYLGLIPSALAVLVMVWLLGRVGVTFMTLNNYLVPVVGSALGVLLLGESFGIGRLSGLALILAGVLLTQYAHRRALKRQKPA